MIQKYFTCIFISRHHIYFSANIYLLQIFNITWNRGILIITKKFEVKTYMLLSGIKLIHGFIPGQCSDEAASHLAKRDLLLGRPDLMRCFLFMLNWGTTFTTYIFVVVLHLYYNI